MAGAEDVTSGEEGHTITCAFEDLGQVSKALEDALGDAESVNIIWKPQNRTPVDEDKAGTLMKLLEALDEDDDVQNVYSNEDIADDVMTKLSA
jgi:transcriptional/translational regulatory protein YebC/TACO1